MCPACVSTALLIAGSVASAGGLAAAAMKTLGAKKATDDGASARRDQPFRLGHFRPRSCSGAASPPTVSRGTL
jgi:hypothetical protein